MVSHGGSSGVVGKMLSTLLAGGLALTGCNGQNPSEAEAGKSMTENTSPDTGQEERLVAIDVLLMPDETMLREAEEWNARLREQSTEGFALDASHRPHITLLQQYVAEDDVPAAVAAVKSLASSTDLASMTLTASGLYHIPSGEVGLQGITIEPSPEILSLQERVIEAMAPFRQRDGDQSAFVPDATGAEFDPFLFTYVDTFAEEQAGAKYNPHVTTGTAPIAWVEAREAEPFRPFTFGVDRLTVYKLGNFGTAAEPLEE